MFSHYELGKINIDSQLGKTKQPKVQIEFYTSSKCVVCLFIEAAFDKVHAKFGPKYSPYDRNQNNIDVCIVPRLAQTLDHVLYLELKFVQNFLLHTEKKKHIFKVGIQYTL